LTRAEFVNRGGLWVLAQVPLMLIALLLPVWLGRGNLFPQHPLSIIGAALTAAGVWLTMWGLKSLGEALTPFPGPLSDAMLHRQGAYRWMRHPIYVGVMLASFGWALWWLSGIGVVFAMVFALFFDRKAAFEEIKLREKYPDYPDYAMKVKKFFPGVY
jgi:protein-S-isoprenylcysteine O-methyltransferase Ste14